MPVNQSTKYFPAHRRYSSGGSSPAAQYNRTPPTPVVNHCNLGSPHRSPGDAEHRRTLEAELADIDAKAELLEEKYEREIADLRERRELLVSEIGDLNGKPPAASEALTRSPSSFAGLGAALAAKTAEATSLHEAFARSREAETLASREIALVRERFHRAAAERDALAAKLAAGKAEVRASEAANAETLKVAQDRIEEAEARARSAEARADGLRRDLERAVAATRYASTRGYRP